MTLDWRTDTERRLPGIPNGVRVTLVFASILVRQTLTVPQLPVPGCGYTVTSGLQGQLQAGFPHMRREQHIRSCEWQLSPLTMYRTS
jgi:hypothetical protein